MQVDYPRMAIDKKSRPVHAVIAERVLGKRLPAGAQVHHVDEDKTNNAHTNLVICQDRAYHALLHVRARVVRAGGDPNTQAICSRCERVKMATEFSVRAKSGNGLNSFCRDCMSDWRRTYARPSQKKNR